MASSVSAPALALENMTLNITQEIHVRAPLLDITFAALLDQLGPGKHYARRQTDAHENRASWPGGRWYRYLGSNNGHFLGDTAQVASSTLSCWRSAVPLFLPYPAVSNVQYRLSEKDGVTLIKFRHTALGLIQEEHRARTWLRVGRTSTKTLACERNPAAQGKTAAIRKIKGEEKMTQTIWTDHQ